MTDITGKIEKITTTGTITKKDGSTIPAVVIKLDNSDDIHRISKNSPAGKFAEKLLLKVGEEVTIVKGGQWNSILKVMKKGSYSSKSGKSFGKSNNSFDSQGARNGMITNKAIDLAIARKTLTTEGLQQAANDVKALADHVESLTVKAKQEIDPFEKTSDTPEASEDFASADEVDF